MRRGIDIDKAEFETAVRDFGAAPPGSKVALFHDPDHGMQVRATNWFVPLDANRSRIRDLDFRMVDASSVLKQMQEAGTKLNVLVLDARRHR